MESKRRYFYVALSLVSILLNIVFISLSYKSYKNIHLTSTLFDSLYNWAIGDIAIKPLVFLILAAITQKSNLFV